MRYTERIDLKRMAPNFKGRELAARGGSCGSNGTIRVIGVDSLAHFGSSPSRPSPRLRNPWPQSLVYPNCHATGDTAKPV